MKRAIISIASLYAWLVTVLHRIMKKRSVEARQKSYNDIFERMVETVAKGSIGNVRKGSKAIAL